MIADCSNDSREMLSRFVILIRHLYTINEPISLIEFNLLSVSSQQKQINETIFTQYAMSLIGLDINIVPLFLVLYAHLVHINFFWRLITITNVLHMQSRTFNHSLLFLLFDQLSSTKWKKNYWLNNQFYLTA
jgi:hypothetical protein